MSFIKYAELDNISADSIKSVGQAFSEFDIGLSILDRFKKTAAELKKIAPKSKDFLYFTAIFMHAAEAALIDDNVNIKKDAGGTEITSHWEEDENNDTLKWVSSDPKILPFKNSNG